LLNDGFELPGEIQSRGGLFQKRGLRGKRRNGVIQSSVRILGCINALGQALTPMVHRLSEEVAQPDLSAFSPGVAGDPDALAASEKVPNVLFAFVEILPTNAS